MRCHVKKQFLSTALVAAALVVFAVPAFAQVDLSGEWGARQQEDQPHRAPGPELGDYAGFPINAALRQKAETWDASILSQPERQTQPHPAQYSLRGGGGPNLTITKLNDPVTEQMVAYRIQGLYGRADRIVWMDDRPHPSDFSEHTWNGFSTGHWEGNTLVVTTTHMKQGVIQRNGLASTPYGVMTEHWMRHGENLTVFTSIDDPAYLEEPFVRTSDWVWNPAGSIANARGQFYSVDELGDKPLGWVPSFPIGTHHTDFGIKYDIPFDVTQGGKATLYPEYQSVIERLRKEEAAKKAEADKAKATGRN